MEANKVINFATMKEKIGAFQELPHGRIVRRAGK